MCVQLLLVVFDEYNWQDIHYMFGSNGDNEKYMFAGSAAVDVARRTGMWTSVGPRSIASDTLTKQCSYEIWVIKYNISI